jgi:hypothetical protein
MSEREFLEHIGRLLQLIEGLEKGQINCPCRRVYRLGITDELKELLPSLRMEFLRRARDETEELVPDSSRFAFLEVD